MKEKIKPRALKKNDVVDVVSLASPPFKPSSVSNGSVFLERKFGLNVHVSPHVRDNYNYLAGCDDVRLGELQRALKNEDSSMILASRGGYGSIRLINNIDYNIVEENPKIIMGYSDITSILLAFWKKTRLITFYGPMLTSEFADDPDDFTVDFFEKMMFGNLSLPLLLCGPNKEKITFAPGKAIGELVGGCLSLLVSTLGTPYEIDTKGKILFFEEVGEAPYRIDHFLTHLINAGKIHECAGIVVGQMTNCHPPKYDPGYPMGSFHWEDVIQERLGGFGIPVMGSFEFGHGEKKIILPIGCSAELNTSEQTLTLLENPFI